jgi:hypothetical protein
VTVDPLSSFRQVWAVDFEFHAPPGERPAPLCCVAREMRSGWLERHWLADGAPVLPPFGTGPDSLFVAFYASAELGCCLALGWPVPARILDLFVEFRCRTSGLPTPCGSSLLGALAYFGADGLGAIEKEELRKLAIRGGPFTPAERLALLDYCQTDVDALARLLPAMLSGIDLPRALLRGRYMAAAARMEWAGVPVDTDTLDRMRTHWCPIKSRLIEEVDRDYGVFVPTGQRVINPETRLGAAILSKAQARGLDPHDLADAVDDVWAEERQATAELFEARRAARKATRLTHRQIDLWEDEGRDHTKRENLDVLARDLAARFPALGIGPGYEEGAGADEVDYAGALWDVLRNRDEKLLPKHDPAILDRAAERVAAYPRDPSSRYRGPMTFSAELFARWLAREGIAWPTLESGALALDDDTFREQARLHPTKIGPIRELRHTLSQMRLNELCVGRDGRNRTLLSAFRAQTGRNQPSNTKFIFGPSTWLRGLIRPEPGRAVAYLDWSQQELAIAAALSGDRKMQEAYVSGDFYLTFAKMAGAVPAEATKRTHAAQREQFKVVSLGVLYGLSAEGLARRLNIPPCEGRLLLRMHQETFKGFWAWSDRIEVEAMLSGRLRTVFGWTVHAGKNANPRSLRNFPMQANGAEMMRLACCLATERGVTVCAPVHDALLIEGPADGIADEVEATQAAMREASELVLPGFPLRTEAKIVRHPDRYMDPRGKRMWDTIGGLLKEIEEAATPCMGARGWLD